MQAIAGPLHLVRSLRLELEELVGDGVDATESRRYSNVSRRIRCPRPPSQTHPSSGSTAIEVIEKSTYSMRDSIWHPSWSSSKHNAPVSVPNRASKSEMLATQVNVQSPSEPRRQFLPVSALGPGLEKLVVPSIVNRGLLGETGRASGSRQALTCRRPTLEPLLVSISCRIDRRGRWSWPYVISVCPIQHMSRTKAVHLFVECSLAAAVFRLTDQTKRNPSFMSPKVARYCEFELKARARTPKECSVMTVNGTSGGESFAVEKMRTLGLYPVCKVSLRFRRARETCMG